MERIMRSLCELFESEFDLIPEQTNWNCIRRQASDNCIFYNYSWCPPSAMNARRGSLQRFSACRLIEKKEKNYNKNNEY